MKKLLLSVPLFLISIASMAQYGMKAVNWPVVDDGVSMVSETTVVDEGTYSAKITSSENKAAFRSGRFSVTAGATYTFSIRVLDNTSDGKLRFYFYFRDECGTDLESSSQYTEDSDNWGTLTFTGTVPEGATAADLKVKVYDDDENPFYIDMATYIENDGENSFTNSGFETWEELSIPTINCDYQKIGNKAGAYITASSNATSGKIYLVDATLPIGGVDDLSAAETAGKAISGSFIQANETLELATANLEMGSYFTYAVDAADMLSEKSRNCIEIILSYDFLPQFWPVYDNGLTLSREKEIVKERTTSLKVSSSENKAALRSGRWTATAGTSYSLSLDVLDNTPDGKLRVYMYFRDACGNDLETANHYTEDSNDWGTVTFTGTVPEGAIAADIKIKVYDDDENPFYLDNAVYTENDGENIFPNPYFEFWENVVKPRVNCDVQQVGTSEGSSAEAGSNASAGTLYLIDGSLEITTVDELEAALTAGQGSKAAISEGEASKLATVELAEMSYFVYAVDQYGEISDKSTSCITVQNDYGYLPQFWTIHDSNVKLRKETSVVKERTSSLKVSSKEKKAAFRSGKLTVTPGANYSLSIDVKENDPEAKLRMYLYFRDNCGNAIESSSVYSEDGEDWLPIQFSGLVPAAAVSADIKFKVYDNTSFEFYLDNAIYTEDEGDNLFPNSYFEFWESVFIPWVINNVLTVTNGENVVVPFSSNIKAGDAILLADTVQNYNLNKIDELVALGAANKSEITTETEELAIPSLSLVPGTYKVLAVDDAGYISAENKTCITVIEVDLVAPIVTAPAQAVSTADGQQIVAQSNETGWVYIILDGEAVDRTTELEAAVQAKKGSVSIVGVTDTDVSIPTDSLMAGSYHAYAVDAQYNISEKGTNAIEISFPTNASSLESFGIQVFPNPVIDLLSITQANQISSYELISMSGEVIKSANNSKSVIKVNTSDINQGIYMLRLYTKNGEQAFTKIIKR